MLKYEKGDRLFCKVNGSEIVSNTTKKFDVELDFEIIGYDNDEYIVLIPSYYNIHHRFHLNETQLNQYDISDIHLNKVGFSLDHDQIVRVFKRSANHEGMFCARCDEWQGYAEANQEDGSMICYLCRTNPWR